MLVPVIPDRELLAVIEACYDAIPRPRTDVEEIGPFTLFIARPDVGHGYYARPRIGETGMDADDTRLLLDRQRELGVPRSIEWVDEVTPGLDLAAEAAGYEVERFPLMTLVSDVKGDAEAARLVDPGDETLLVQTRAAIAVAFDNAGTARGDASTADRDAALDSPHARLHNGFRAAVRQRQFIVAAAFVENDPGAGPVGGGSLMPAGRAAEIAGVGVLPAYRRRGLAAQITHVLAAEARRLGVETVFCSADSDDVARVYAGVGFRRIGTACIATAPT
jgi:ribosomal protein S18 acetylase RimI-like enzyme